MTTSRADRRLSLGPRKTDPPRAAASLVAARQRAADAGLADDPAVKAALESVYRRIEAVMNEEVGYREAASVIKAAQALADGIAGRQTERIEARGAITLASLVEQSLTVRIEGGRVERVIEAKAEAARELPTPAPALPSALPAVPVAQPVSLPAPIPLAPGVVMRSEAVAPLVRRKAKGSGGTGSGGVEGGGVRAETGLEGAGDKNARGAPRLGEGGTSEPPTLNSPNSLAISPEPLNPENPPALSKGAPCSGTPANSDTPAPPKNPPGAPAEIPPADSSNIGDLL